MYTYKRQVNLPYARAVEKVKTELQKEGFGVLTEIDVKATLKKKLDVDYDDYVIGIANYFNLSSYTVLYALRAAH